MSKKSTAKGTPRKARPKKAKTRAYRPITPQAYDVVSMARASDSEPINQENAQIHLAALLVRLEELYSPEGGDTDAFNGVSDTALMLKVAIDAGFCDDSGCEFQRIHDDLDDAVAAHADTGRYRLKPESRERLQGVAEAIKEVFENLPERTFISLHRATTTIKRAIQRGEISSVLNLKEFIK